MFGNEGSGVVEVCLFPWSKDTLPTAKDIVPLFHFHPELRKKTLEHTSLSDEEDDCDEDEGMSWNGLRSFISDDKERAVNFFKWLKKIFTPFIYIGIGCDLMNPVVCFLLGHIAPGWVGGVLTSVVCTWRDWQQYFNSIFVFVLQSLNYCNIMCLWVVQYKWPGIFKKR